MSYPNIAVPEKLKEIQQWFGEIIAQPLVGNDQIFPFSPQGSSIQLEASKHLLASPTLASYQRIEIYNQQYWWRLFKNLEEIFPLLVHLLGQDLFEKKIAIPFLQAYPPHHWSLNHLGDFLPDWLKKNEKSDQRKLFMEASQVDLSCVKAYYSARIPPPKEFESNSFIILQPHVTLLGLDYDLPALKTQLHQNKRLFEKIAFSPLTNSNSPYYYIIYQNSDNHALWKKLTPTVYHVLSQFQRELSIEQLCEWLENQDKIMQEEAQHQFQNWFQDWFSHQWLQFINKNEL